MILILMLIIRLVELDKLRLATRKEEEAAIAAKGGIDPFYLSQHDDGDSGGGGFDDYDCLVKTKIENELSVMPPSASKGGVGEKLIKVRGSGRQYCFFMVGQHS